MTLRTFGLGTLSREKETYPILYEETQLFNLNIMIYLEYFQLPKKIFNFSFTLPHFSDLLYIYLLYKHYNKLCNAYNVTIIMYVI